MAAVPNPAYRPVLSKPSTPSTSTPSNGTTTPKRPSYSLPIPQDSREKTIITDPAGNVTGIVTGGGQTVNLRPGETAYYIPGGSRAPPGSYPSGVVTPSYPTTGGGQTIRLPSGQTVPVSGGYTIVPEASLKPAVQRGGTSVQESLYSQSSQTGAQQSSLASQALTGTSAPVQSYVLTEAYQRQQAQRRSAILQPQFTALQTVQPTLSSQMSPSTFSPLPISPQLQKIRESLAPSQTIFSSFERPELVAQKTEQYVQQYRREKIEAGILKGQLSPLDILLPEERKQYDYTPKSYEQIGLSTETAQALRQAVKEKNVNLFYSQVGKYTPVSPVLPEDIAYEKSAKAYQMGAYAPPKPTPYESFKTKIIGDLDTAGYKYSVLEPDPLKGSLLFYSKVAVSGAEAFASPFVAIGDVVSSPLRGLSFKETGEKAYEYGKSFLLFPVTYGQEAITALREARANPYGLAKPTGEALALIFGGKILKGFVGKAKDVYIMAGSKYIEPEFVFAESVLKGRERLPTVESTAEAMRRFSEKVTPEGTIEVSTASPQKIIGETVEIGKKSAIGIEDPGIYTTPRGEASPYFTRVEPDIPTTYSLNPLKGAKEIIGVPTVTTFEVKGVTQYPREVLETPGFEAVKIYQETIGKRTGKVYITKRSMIGQGDIVRQKFFNPEEGRVVFEKGTSEIEAVIPIGSRFKYVDELKGITGKLKGFEEYTTYKGRAIALRKAKVVGEFEKGETLKVDTDFVTKIESQRDLVYSDVSKVKTPGVVFSSQTSKTSAQSLVSSKVSQISKQSVLSRQTSSLSSLSSVTSKVSSEISEISSAKSATSRTTPSTVTSNLSKVSPQRRPYFPTAPIYTANVNPQYVAKLEEETNLSKGYDVYVRERGQYIKVNRKPQTYEAAFQQGAYYVDNTTAATFKLRPVDKKPAEQEKFYYTSKEKFIKSKKYFETYTEPPRYRIDTSGEVRGLRASRLLAQEKKKGFVNFQF